VGALYFFLASPWDRFGEDVSWGPLIDILKARPKPVGTPLGFSSDPYCLFLENDTSMGGITVSSKGEEWTGGYCGMGRNTGKHCLWRGRYQSVPATTTRAICMGGGIKEGGGGGGQLKTKRGKTINTGQRGRRLGRGEQTASTGAPKQKKRGGDTGGNLKRDCQNKPHLYTTRRNATRPHAIGVRPPYPSCSQKRRHGTNWGASPLLCPTAQYATAGRASTRMELCPKLHSFNGLKQLTADVSHHEELRGANEGELPRG